MENKDFYVYIQIRLSNGEPFNVGEGRGRRGYAKNNRCKEWYEIVESEGGFDTIIVEKNLTKEESLLKETYWINRLSKLHKLVNVKNLTIFNSDLSRLEKCEIAKDKGYTYNPLTGEVFGLKNNLLKSLDGDGYLIFIMCHNKKKYHIKQHHFAWFMAHGGNLNFELLNHINGNRSDNRIVNLEITNCGGNQHHRKTPNVYFNSKRNEYTSRITVLGKSIHLGVFKTKEEAVKSYYDAKNKYHKQSTTVNDLPSTERKGYFFMQKKGKFKCKVTINKKTYYKEVKTEEEAKEYVKFIRENNKTI
jgi:hypothetical protein